MSDRSHIAESPLLPGLANRWTIIPAWLVSLLLHALVLIAAGLTIELGPPGGLLRADRFGLVLSQLPRTVAGDDGGGDDSDPAEPAPAGAGVGVDDSLESLLAEPAPLDPAVVLGGGTASNQRPAGAGRTGSASGGEGLLPGAGKFTSGGGASKALTRGRGRTSVFGTVGEGYKFVYVFDRSGSMGGSGRTALARAKAELIASLEILGEMHQFQIIFYNDEPVIMELAGRSRLVFGNDQNKELARRFIGSITADGATDHLDALLMALHLRPDVIFFLTDADEPSLTRSQLARVRELNNGLTAINTIEFGLGPSLGDNNFLVTMARENGGQHVYVDISTRSAAR